MLVGPVVGACNLMQHVVPDDSNIHVHVVSGSIPGRQTCGPKAPCDTLGGATFSTTAASGTSKPALIRQRTCW